MNPVLLHFVTQIGIAALGAAVSAAAGLDYSALCVWAGALQAGTALLTTLYNNYFGAHTVPKA